MWVQIAGRSQAGIGESAATVQHEELGEKAMAVEERTIWSADKFVALTGPTLKRETRPYLGALSFMHGPKSQDPTSNLVNVTPFHIEYFRLRKPQYW